MDTMKVLTAAKEAGVSAKEIGQTGGKNFRFVRDSIPVEKLKEIHEHWFPDYMSAPDSH